MDNPGKPFIKALDYAHLMVSRRVMAGDQVVDATAGNGHDTLFLARLVGPGGKVVAFDLQEKAIENTGKLLQQNKLTDRVRLIRDGHENMSRYLSGSYAAIMFNLGYLPGSDHRITTRPDTTIKALGAALDFLAPGGLVTLVVYTGHPGGQEEWLELEKYSISLDHARYLILLYRFINRLKSPFLVAIIKQ